MTIDNETNLLWLAGTLVEKEPCFSKQFEQVLRGCGIKVHLLPSTMNIWARDYMPIQVGEDDFVQFTYRPDYLRRDKEGKKTMSDMDAICEAINLRPRKSSILVDGGNVVRGKNKVIMCDKVFKENPKMSRRALRREIEKLLRVDTLIVIPTQPGDMFGHADGLVRFLDERTVLTNQYSDEDKKFSLSLQSALKRAGINSIEIPYDPYHNKDTIDATGIYMNFLHMKDIIIIPTFGSNCDEKAVRQFEDLLTGTTIRTVSCNDIAPKGGLLNCITWSVLQTAHNRTYIERE